MAYGLNDGANITNATTTVGGQTRVGESSTYPGGRLATRSSTSTPPLGAPTTADSTFSYSALGEETQRSTTAAGITSTTTTEYDAAGHVAKAVSGTQTVDYLYDGTDHLLARRGGGETTLYFYWGPGSSLAEETDGAGQSLARYVVDGAEPVAQHTFRRILGGGKDPTDIAGTWAWNLDDPAGNVATTVGDNGAVLSQAAFDPYGVPEATGKSKAPGPDAKTSLGFQSALTDPTTDKVILGPRQYDPKTARFTNPDVFVSGSEDLALGTDPLTGNRYLFAGANPVAFYEDGHGPCSLLGHNPAKRGEKHGGCRGGRQVRTGARAAKSAGQAALIAAAAAAAFEEALAHELGLPGLGLSGRRSAGGAPRSAPGTAIRQVGRHLESVDDVFTNPRLLAGRSPAEVRAILGEMPGWVQGGMRHSKSAPGGGWTFLELNRAGTDFTDRYIQWHPGRPRHFNGDPYWKVSSGQGGTQWIPQ